MGKLKIPAGAPKGAADFPPFPGATKNWSDKTLSVVRSVRAKAPGIVIATYKGHGRTGEEWGADLMVGPFGKVANPEQARFGAALVQWLEANWSRLGLNYIIWWNQMNDGNGWFDYSPWSKPASQGGWPGGSPIMATRRHQDHVHIQVDNPNVPGNE